jgi:hypothetical protein
VIVDERDTNRPESPVWREGIIPQDYCDGPAEIYERLVRESARRKIAGEPNQLLSALLREAITKYLDLLPDR